MGFGLLDVTLVLRYGMLSGACRVDQATGASQSAFFQGLRVLERVPLKVPLRVP